MPQISLHTPTEDLTVTEEDDAIIALDWGWSPVQDSTSLLLEAKAQLHAYFDGALQTFDLPLKPEGSDYQKTVWSYLQTILYGETCTYGAVAKAIASAAQSVGAACGMNPIPIIIPCHRVISQSTLGGHIKLGGYSGEGGTHTKEALLILEGALPPKLF